MPNPALAAAGVLSVRCTTCRAGVGRPCTNPRGYYLDRGVHPARRSAWTLAELAEARGV